VSTTPAIRANTPQDIAHLVCGYLGLENGLNGRAAFRVFTRIDLL
jgi:hypothetical protein